MRFPVLILVPFLALSLTTAHANGTASLPDTGQSLCDNGSNALVACTNVNAGDAATYPRQDGRFGRDAKATAGTLTKTGAGAVGFDYTKVANNGTDLAAGATLGTAATAWACTRDNVTGLTWEVKTSTNTDLRYSGHTYTWYSTDGSTNGGNAGNAGANTCSATLPDNLCNTQAFITAVNAVDVNGLCSYSDWRLPNRREFSTLVHFGVQNPSIDTTYFPNTQASYFWSASSYVPLPPRAWHVHFGYGNSNYFVKTNGAYVRLVRGGQF